HDMPSGVSPASKLRIVHVRPVQLHKPLRSFHRSKTNLRIKTMRIARSEDPAPQALQHGILGDALHQPLSQSSTAMRFQHKNIAHISNGGEIADHTGKTHL